jgi:hypothetical protein
MGQYGLPAWHSLVLGQGKALHYADAAGVGRNGKLSIAAQVLISAVKWLNCINSVLTMD